MKQFLNKEDWKDHVTQCVQSLDDSSAAGCPLPWCTTPWEGVLKRRFHLQDVHCVEFTKGIKRDRSDYAAEDQVPTATDGDKRRCVNQAGPNRADGLHPTMGHHFIDETVEIIKSQAFSPTPQEPKVVQRRIQRETSDPNPAVFDGGSPSPSTTRPSTSALDHRSPFMPLIDVAPESLESLLDPDFLCSKNSTSRSSSPAASQDIATAQGDEEDETELPSLRSLLGLDSTRPYSEDAPNQKSLSESTLRLWGWAEVPGPNGLPVLQELSDHESEAPAPLTSDARQARGITAFALENQSVLTSGNNSTSERLHHGHKLTDKLKAADSEWALRGYPRISWRTLDARLQKFSPALRGILNGATPSFYRSELESAVARRADPKFRCMENAKAGYYGPRGQQVM